MSNEQVRVLHIVGGISGASGGVAFAVDDLASALAEKDDLSISVIATSDTGSAVGKSSKPYNLVRLASFGPNSFGYCPSLLSSILQLKPDVVHAHGIWMHLNSVVTKWHKLTGRNYILSPHGMLDSWAIKNSSFKKKIANLCFQRSNLVNSHFIHALNSSEANSIKSIVHDANIIELPNGVDISSNSTILKSPPWREDGKKVLLYLGRIHPKKNLANLIKAWLTLRPHEWKLVVAGWGRSGYQDELSELANSMSCQGEIDFIGPQFDNEKLACFRNATAFILPSLSEGLPIAILEAWASNATVLMTPECNLEIGFQSNAAIRIGTSSEDIQKGILSMLNMSIEEHVEMGNAGRKLVEEAYSWTKIANEFSKIYHAVKHQDGIETN